MKLAQRDPRPGAEQSAGPPTSASLQRLDAPYLVIDVDRQKAANVGLSPRDVILQVVAAMNSSVSINRNFWIDTKSGNQYFVACSTRKTRHATLEDAAQRRRHRHQPDRPGQAQQPGRPSAAARTPSRSTTSACTASSTCWSTPRTATSAAWPATSKQRLKDMHGPRGHARAAQGRVRAA